MTTLNIYRDRKSTTLLAPDGCTKYWAQESNDISGPQSTASEIADWCHPGEGDGVSDADEHYRYFGYRLDSTDAAMPRHWQPMGRSTVPEIGVQEMPAASAA